MAQQPTGGNRAQEITRKLRSLRDACAEQPREERRQRFREALDEELSGLPGDEAEQIIGSVRDRLIEDARLREQRLTELEAEVGQLRSQVDSLTTENSGLARENRQLKGDALLMSQTSSGTVGATLQKMREGLRLMTDEKEVTAESLDFGEAEGRLFRMIQALLAFALNYEVGVNLLLSEFSIGPTGEMNTAQYKTYMKLVRDRFRACLDNEEGSIRELKTTLDRNSRFLIDLNTAYTASVYEGSQKVFSKLDPQTFLDKHKGRVMGFNFEEAFNDLKQELGDVGNYSRSELWARFFYKPFREKLAEYMDARPFEG